MDRIYKVGRRCFDSAIQGDASSLRQLFEHRVRLWSDPSYEREIRPARLFANFSGKIRSQQAFRLLPIAVEIVLEKETGSEVECGLWLIWQLAECSYTTELPEALRKYLPWIRCRSSEYGDATLQACDEILRYYRLKPTAFEFLEPWHSCSNVFFNDELLREVSRDHVLYGMDAKVIARRQDIDDFLFELSDGRFANVHLTWAKETNPEWPATEIYESRAAMEFEIQRQIDEWNEIESDGRG